jgi:ABC-type multidrug transport system ATPase subunit/pSer/pThr/pTyr-binding forkhead associated (FHA) protein
MAGFRCPFCGQSMRSGARYCSNCGQTAASPPGAGGGKGRQAGTALVSTTQLTIRWPGGQTQVVPIQKDVLCLGRDGSNDVVVDFRTVSRQHARLEKQNGVYHVVDLGSTNGTTLNGQQLAANARYPLKQGDVLRIGDVAGNSVSLTFADGSAPGGPMVTRELDLRGRTSLVLGRAPQCDVPLPAPTVSWHHARVDQTASGVVLRDLGSTNGTFVGGRRVTAHRLQPGDRIQIGPFQLVYQPSSLTQIGGILDFRLDGLGLLRRVQDRQKKGETKIILNDVSLSIRPGEFVALVGGSGAGKSTLMNALSGFKRADGGQVLVNGTDLYENFGLYRTQMGYVPQDDIIHLGLPVYNALRYAAWLRLPPDTLSQETGRRIDEVLRKVGMTEQKKQLVSSLSGGQRKRVNIGLELLAEPGLFFLDEPTSGLDPGLEKRMMDTLRHLSDEGRTIVLVTHATANITLCDLVAFMAQGRLVFVGPPDEARRFFGVADFADIYTSLEPPPTPGNPEPDPVQVAEQWEARFRASPCYQTCVSGRQASIQRGRNPGRAAASTSPGPAHTSPGMLLRQFLILARRYFELILRDRMSLIVLLAVMPCIGLLLLLIGQRCDLIGETADEIARQVADRGSYRVVARAQTLLLMMSLAAVLLGLFGASYEIIREWAIYRRERMVNLAIGPYVLSKVMVLMGFALVQCLALLAVLSLKVELPERGILLAAPLEMYVTLLLATLTSVALGLLISALVRSQNMVIYVILVILFVQIIFAGVLFDLPKATTPLSYLTVTRWTMEALGSTADMEALKSLGKSEVILPADPALGLPEQRHEIPDKFELKLDYTHTKGHLLSRWAILLAFAGLWLGLTGVTLRSRDEL